MVKEKKILLISHDASRTGAPIVMKNLALLLNECDDVQFEILIKHSKIKSLYKDFKSLAPTSFLSSWTKRINLSLFKNLFFLNLNRSKIVKKYIFSFDTVISNTITNGDMHFYLKDHPNVITYVHELEEAIVNCTTPKNLQNVIKHSNCFLYPSIAVKENLQINYKIDEKKLFQIPAYIPDRFHEKEINRNLTRCKLQIKKSEFLIIGIGTNSWTKGPDIFIQTILFAKKNGLNVIGVWLGSNINSIEHRRLLYDIKKMNLTDYVSILPPANDVINYLSAADLFFLSSREDSYPLVMIEAAMMELPIMYFKGSGGASEFVETDAGIALEYGRIDSVVSQLSELINDTELHQKYAINAREKYLRFHSKESVSNSINDILNFKK